MTVGIDISEKKAPTKLKAMEIAGKLAKVPGVWKVKVKPITRITVILTSEHARAEVYEMHGKLIDKFGDKYEFDFSTVVEDAHEAVGRQGKDKRSV